MGSYTFGCLSTCTIVSLLLKVRVNFLCCDAWPRPEGQPSYWGGKCSMVPQSLKQVLLGDGAPRRCPAQPSASDAHTRKRTSDVHRPFGG